jgi:hypothetical protein
MEKKTYIRDLYRFEGFRARATMKPHPDDSNGWIITLDRRQKKQLVQCAGQGQPVFGIEGYIRYGIWTPAQRTSILNLNIVGSTARTVKP